MRYYRELWNPDFDKIRSQIDGLMTKAEFDLHIAEIHKRFDRLHNQSRELSGAFQRVEDAIAPPDQSSIAKLPVPRKLD